MTNKELREKKEKKGFKIRANISNCNGEQTIINYTLLNKNGSIIKTKKNIN
jgi:hypothetical protein